MEPEDKVETTTTTKALDNSNAVRDELKTLIKDSIQSEKKGLYDEIKSELHTEFAVKTESRTNPYENMAKGQGLAFQKALPFMVRSLVRDGTMTQAYNHFKEKDAHFYKAFLGEQAANGGGDKVIPRPLWDDVIPALYKRLALTQVGATQISLPSGRLDFGRQNAKPVAYYKDEGAALTTSQAGFERLSLTAQKLTVLTDISNEFLARDAIVSESFIMDDLMKAAATRMDEAFLRGRGHATYFEPVGIHGHILTQSNINYTAVGTNPGSPATVGDLEKALIEAELKVLDGNHQGPFAFLVPDKVFLNMRRQRTANGVHVFPGLQDAAPSLNGYPVYRSNNILTDADDNTSGDADQSRIYFGDFSSVIIGVGRRAELEASRHSLFGNDETQIRLIMDHDLILRYKDALVQINCNIWP